MSTNLALPDNYSGLIASSQRGNRSLESIKKSFVTFLRDTARVIIPGDIRNPADLKTRQYDIVVAGLKTSEIILMDAKDRKATILLPRRAREMIIRQGWVKPGPAHIYEEKIQMSVSTWTQIRKKDSTGNEDSSAKGKGGQEEEEEEEDVDMKFGKDLNRNDFEKKTQNGKLGMTEPLLVEEPDIGVRTDYFSSLLTQYFWP